MNRCGNHHPQKDHVICDRPPRRHPTCSGWDRDIPGFTDWENQTYAETKVTTPEQARAQARQLATRITPQHAAEGRDRTRHRWTISEQLLVRAAIVTLARERDSFTTDDVWDQLGPQVVKTPGIAAMLREADRDGYIEPTEQYADSRRADRDDHDQGRRLRVWRSRCRVG